MQLLRHVLGVIGLESAVMRGLKEDQDGHDLTGMQLARPSALPLARGQHLTVPQRLEADPELVDRAEEFEYTHDRNLLMIGTVDRAAIVSGGFSFGDFAYPELTLNSSRRTGKLSTWRSQAGDSTPRDEEVREMRDADTVLGIIRARGKRGLPVEDLYRQLYNPLLYLRAYATLYAHQGAMTPGVTE